MGRLPNRIYTRLINMFIFVIPYEPLGQRNERYMDVYSSVNVGRVLRYIDITYNIGSY